MNLEIMHMLKSMQASSKEMQTLNLEPRKNGQKVNLELSSVVGMVKNRESQRTTQSQRKISMDKNENTARVSGKI